MNWMFGVPGRQSYLILELLFSELFYILPISVAKGVAERSPSQIKTSCVSGVVATVLSTGAIIALTAYKIATNADLSPLSPRHLSGIFIGGVVGNIFSVGHRKYFFIAVGVLAGALGLLLLIPLSVLLQAGSLLIWKLTSSMDAAMLYEKLGIPAFEGFFQSVIPWATLSLLESHRYEKKTDVCA